MPFLVGLMTLLVSLNLFATDALPIAELRGLEGTYSGVGLTRNYPCQVVAYDMADGYNLPYQGFRFIFENSWNEVTQFDVRGTNIKLLANAYKKGTGVVELTEDHGRVIHIEFQGGKLRSVLLGLTNNSSATLCRFLNKK